LFILAAQLLFVFFVLREEFAFLFQTFSRSDPPGKAPLTRGRYVFQKKEKKKKEKKEKKKKKKRVFRDFPKMHNSSKNGHSDGKREVGGTCAKFVFSIRM